MMDLNFPGLDTTASSPLSDEEMDNKFFSSSWDKENLSQRQLVRTAQIENDKYWIWLYKALAGKSKKQYVIIKQEESGKTSYNSSCEDVHYEPDMKLNLLKFHYSA